MQKVLSPCGIKPERKKKIKSVTTCKNLFFSHFEFH